jgi:hypothetical protein
MKISSNVNIELTRTTKHENKMSRVQVVSQNPLRVDSSLARARDFPLLLSAQTRGMHFRPFQMAFGSFTTGGGAFFSLQSTRGVAPYRTQKCCALGSLVNGDAIAKKGGKRRKVFLPPHSLLMVKGAERAKKVTSTTFCIFMLLFF